MVFFDALRVKIREDAVVRKKAIYLALGVLPDGTRDWLYAGRRDGTGDCFRAIVLKNSVREVERAGLRKPTSQIDPGSTIGRSRPRQGSSDP